MKAMPGCLTVPLPPFTYEETCAFVSSVLEGDFVSERLSKVIWEMTGGWPLYAEQVTRSQP